MAKKKETESKVVLERTYNIPLRKEYLKAATYRRSKKAVAALRSFLEKNMKSTDVKISDNINRKIWEHGIHKPPHHVKVIARKLDSGIVEAELFDAPAPKVKETKTAKKPAEKKKAEKVPETEEVKVEDAEPKKPVKKAAPKKAAPKTSKKKTE